MNDPTHLERLPILPFMDPRLARAPGLLPFDPRDWLIRDTAFAAQMALRDRLIAERRGEVLAARDEARAAAEELLGLAMEAVGRAPGYAVVGWQIRRPDGV
ncbi:MAG TPA: heme-dependent oxidative N-demethylase subunit alpha family protein, partial [Paracoccaceae bacterium]|nr:heme-dependent oxidative N-demethylase subunit alpha family protein [Paracoccaceae bacterium]